MHRFLYSPAILFNARLVNWLQDHVNHPVTTPIRRIFIRPIADGLRMNNMGVTRSLDITVEGGQVKLDPTVDNISLVDQIQYFSLDDFGTIASQIIAFFDEE